LTQYFQYRYGELSFQLQKSSPIPNEKNEFSSSAYHRSLSEIKSSLKQLLEERKEELDRVILMQLRDYIASLQVVESQL
jgi:hypothetical protein